METQRGSALLMAVVVSVAAAAIAAAIITVALLSNRQSAMSWEMRQTLLIAEAGVSASIREINSNEDPDGDGLGTISGSYAGGSYVVTAVYDQTGDRYTLTAVATFGNLRKGVEAVVEPGLPFPGAAAVTLFGPAGEVEFEIEDNQVELSGLSDQKPALVVQDPNAFSMTLSQILEQIDDGLPPNTLKGSPLLTYTTPAGDTVDLPIGQSNSVQFDGPFLESLRTTVIDKTLNEFIPNATHVFHNDQDITAPMNFGTEQNPAIVVFDGSDIDIKSGGHLTGNGILIVTGELQVEHLGKLDWNGTVIVLGGDGFDGDAEFENQRGHVNIKGNLFVVGANGGEAELEIDNPGGNQISHTNIDGAVLVLGGGAGEEAELEIEEGNTVINGLVLVQGGDEVEFELENDDDGAAFNGVLNINGAVSIGVMNEGGEIEVELEGNANIKYHKNNILAAIQGLNTFVSQLNLPMPYVVKAWREINP